MKLTKGGREFKHVATKEIDLGDLVFTYTADGYMGAWRLKFRLHFQAADGATRARTIMTAKGLPARSALGPVLAR